MRTSTLAVFAAASLSVIGVSALSPDEWRKQSIYQVLTDRFARTDGSSPACDSSRGVYCGGTWRGIINKLDYIQGLGATAIWISPFVKNLEGNTLDGESYHGFWAQDIFAVNPHFGTEDDLIALADALHSRGMFLMMDIVANHMAFAGCRSCVDYSVFTPFNSSSFFHPGCAIDYSNETSIQQCWQGSDNVALPDLRTEDADVRAVFDDWIADVVTKYKLDGLRIDSAKHQEPSFWPPFARAAGVYLVGEVLEGDPVKAIPFQDVLDGVLNYPAFFWITQAFESSTGSIQNLVNGINTMKSQARDLGLWGSFLENHDQPRFPSLTQDKALAKNAMAFTMLMDGIPIVYQGQEQHYAGGDVPNNREALWLSGYNTNAELYKWVASLNRLRAHAIQADPRYLNYSAWPIFSNSNVIAMRKGFDGAQIVGVYSNVGTGRSFSTNLPSTDTGFTAGQQLVDVMSCTTTTVDSSGSLAVSSSNGEPRVYYPQSRLSGSGLCTTLNSSAAATTAWPWSVSVALLIFFISL